MKSRGVVSWVPSSAVSSCAFIASARARAADSGLTITANS